MGSHYLRRELFRISISQHSKEEILEAIDGIKLGKACGKDGLPIEFYATHTRVDDEDINSNYLTKILYKMFLESQNRGELPTALKENIVALILKKNSSKIKYILKTIAP